MQRMRLTLSTQPSPMCANEVAIIPAVAQMMTKNTIAHIRTVPCKETGFSDSLIKGSGQIKHREQENPHQIHEMPEQAGDFDAVGEAFRVGLPHAAARAPQIENHQRA